MIVVITEDQINEAKAIMERYNAKLMYSKVYLKNETKPYYAISQGPIGALLLIRAELCSDDIQKRFGLL